MRKEPDDGTAIIGFFKVRIDRLTKAEIQFVKAMAELGDGPYAMADIAQTMGCTQNLWDRSGRASSRRG
ncbi:hypothetical protein [Sphingobium sp. CR28]|uniref:hypothetical protein n=1 Tax=Sphingobium sp. CR28 TaxID=3400272 RepID=UPI003FF0788E